MKQPLRHLIIGTAVGVFSLGAYAQSTSMTPPPPTSPKMTTGTMSDGDYNAAKAACNAQTGAARSDCLRKAKTAHDQGETNKGGGGTDASSGGGQSGASSGNAGTTGGATGGASSSGATGGATGGTSGGNAGGASGGGAAGGTSGGNAGGASGGGAAGGTSGGNAGGASGSDSGGQK